MARSFRLATPLFFLAVVGGLASCSELVPRFELRDDYTFKRFFQPDRVVGDIEHDANGNAVLPKKDAAN